LLHYHLCAPHRIGPIFWNRLVLSSLRIGSVLDRSALATTLVNSTEADGTVSYHTLAEAATAFLGTYSRDDALGSLRILRAAASNKYEVTEATEPAAHVFAYVIADYWTGNWGARKTVSLESVTTESGGPASLLLLGSGQANRLLREMQAEGLVEVQRRAAPYQVVRLWDDAAQLLERVYV
jgi:hypothetical protein